MGEAEAWMREALRLARSAGGRGEVPVGAVAVIDGMRIAAASNRMEAAHDATAHAEMLCLRRAAPPLGTLRLHSPTLYVTLQPSPLCASALVLGPVRRLGCPPPPTHKEAGGSPPPVPPPP